MSEMEMSRRIAMEAARLRYEEPDLYREYIHAKRSAAYRLNSDIIPTNKEVYECYQEIADAREGKEERQQRLKAMRVEAIQWMKLFEPFKPVLIGSVSRGDVTSRSDIDIHVFVENSEDEFIDFLNEHDVVYDYEIKEVRKPGEGIKEYHHVRINYDFTVEVTVYIESEYEMQKCSIFGIPIKGLKFKAVESLL
jgi:predicted nucleotidyltransferase